MKTAVRSNKEQAQSENNMVTVPPGIADFFVGREVDHLQVLDSLDEGVQIFDHELRLVYCNAKAVSHHPSYKPHFMGKTITKTCPEIISTALFQAILNCLEKRLPITFENLSTHPEGQSNWFLYQVKPITNGVLVLSADISERKLLEQNLKANEEYYHSFFNNLLNGFAYCQLLYTQGEVVDFTFLAVNKAFENLTGLHDVTGKQVSAIIPGFSHIDHELFETFSRVAVSGQSLLVEKYSITLKQWLNLSIYSPVKDHFVAIFDVITRRKETESKLVEQINELQRWYSATIDREERNIELKREVNELLMESGKPPRYADIGDMR